MQTGRYHHIFDLSGCNEHIADEASLRSFIEEVSEAIGMHILVGPVVAHGIEENPGLTAFAIVDFSHISVHTFTAHGDALIDIFSCKEYDRAKAEEVCVRFFSGPQTEVRHQEVFWG